MTQTTNRFFDEIGRLMNDAAGAAQGVKREVDAVMRNQAERILRDLDLVKREEFEAVKDMARLGLKAVTFEGGGEPTLSPCFDEAVALSQSLGLQVGLVTMGEFLDLKPGRLELVAKAMSWVRVSIDAATDTTHAALHRVKPGTLERVWANIAKLRALNPDLLIGYSFVVSEHNWPEVVRAMEKAVELGCSYIQFKPVAMEHETFWYTEESNDLVKQAVALAGDRIKVFAPRFEYDANERLVNRCYMHRFATHVGANGDVYVCCYLPIRSGGLVKLGKRKEMEGVLGNLNQQSFTEIWEGKRRMAMVKALEESDHFVKKCPSCRFDRQNQMLHAIKSKGNSFL
jgi:MoaA/NifB/PqqE/SkfB family radical SAM enzyme